MVFSKALAASTAALLALSGGAEAQATYGFFETSNDVNAHASIDLDVKAISGFVKASPANFSEGQLIYTDGENSKKSGDKMRTIAGFSTGLKANTGKKGLTKENFPEYFQAVEYWGGKDDYANLFVTAAFEGTGDMNLDDVSRAQLALKGMQYQNIWMYVLYEAAAAVTRCELKKDGGDSDGGSKNWDEAAVFYIGTLVGEKGETGTKGGLQYTLAEKRCAAFKTCNTDAETPVANVNAEVIQIFKDGVTAIKNEDCDALSMKYKDLVPRMLIPLIQGYLYYAKKSAAPEATPKDNAETWAFAAGALPSIAKADAAAAATIRKDLEWKTGVTKLVPNGIDEVYKATYKTLGAMCISCEDLGVNNLEGVPECKTDEDALKKCSAGKSNTGLIVGLVVTCVVLIGVSIVFVRYVSKSDDNKKSTEVSQQNSAV